ncbi:MAG: PP2C family serine/threonine-protein phosphatase [Pseudomonadota bacterium]
MPFLSAGATQRGPQHMSRGEPRQDALSIRHHRDGVLLALADGAGSASRGGAGAALAVRTAVQVINGVQPDAEALEDAVFAAKAAVDDSAAQHGLTSRDLATTLLLVAATPWSVIAAHVGDGAVVLHTDGGWLTLSQPARGMHASTTHFLTDAAGPDLRITTHDAPPTAIAAFTDGIERLVLAEPQQTPHAPFFDKMTAPLRAADGSVGRSRFLSRALADYLAAPAVAERSEDDKTLALAVPAKAP